MVEEERLPIGDARSSLSPRRIARLGASALGYMGTRKPSLFSPVEVTMLAMADFKKRIYSGVCLCGHSYEDHHLSMVMNPEAYAIMGPHLPAECVFFGTNEDAGLDENGDDHCHGYVDVDEPDPAVRSAWLGTKR